MMGSDRKLPPLDYSVIVKVNSKGSKRKTSHAAVTISRK